MIGYLFYNRNDVQRNKSFIKWLTDEAENLNIKLYLKHCSDLYSDEPLPDFIINRSRDHKVSYFYDQLNIPVFNSYDVINITNDKLKTYEYFHQNITMLDTKEYDGSLTFPCIVKKKDGHGGLDVHLLDDQNSIKPEFNEDYIVQPLAPILGKDLRVYIVGNQIVDAVLRTNPNSFKSNYSLGGNIELYSLSDSECDLINQIIMLLPLDYAGIDFLFDEDNHLILNEIEDAVGARMLCTLTNHNVASLYIEHIASKLKHH